MVALKIFIRGTQQLASLPLGDQVAQRQPVGPGLGLEHFDQQQLPDLKEEVAKAASAVGRDISQITVAPQILCCVADNPEELAQVER